MVYTYIYIYIFKFNIYIYIYELNKTWSMSLHRCVVMWLFCIIVRIICGHFSNWSCLLIIIYYVTYVHVCVCEHNYNLKSYLLVIKKYMRISSTVLTYFVYFSKFILGPLLKIVLHDIINFKSIPLKTFISIEDNYGKYFRTRVNCHMHPLKTAFIDLTLMKWFN